MDTMIWVFQKKPHCDLRSIFWRSIFPLRRSAYMKFWENTTKLLQAEGVRRMYREPTVLYIKFYLRKHDGVRTLVYACACHNGSFNTFVRSHLRHNHSDPALYSPSLRVGGGNSKINFLTNAKEWENGLKTDYRLFPQLPAIFFSYLLMLTLLLAV